MGWNDHIEFGNGRGWSSYLSDFGDETLAPEPARPDPPEDSTDEPMEFYGAD